MSYRKIPEDKILKFSATPGFKGWKHFFTEESVSHPAKMNLNLLRHILKTYTEKGDVVLDPMAGTGSTIVLASMIGRNGIAVEFEPKFCDMIQGNIARAEKQATFTTKGVMKCYQGDARELSSLLGESDAIITSPPYGNRLSDVAIQDADPARMGYRQTVDVVLTSPPYEKACLDGKNTEQRAERLRKAGYDPNKYLGGHARNTILRSYTEVDSIVTSPPYGSDNANLQGREDKSAKSILGSTGVRSVDLDPENLGRLEYGDIDAVVMSPPYEDSVSAQDEGWLEEHWDDESASPKHKTMRFGRSMRGYKEIDSIITSPPFNERTPRIEPKNGKSLWKTLDTEIETIKAGYVSDENIGNLKGETYLEAMLRVYQESYKVLRARGKMVLVTKNFIRNKQVVRLDLDTIKLCESVGFKLIDHLYFDLPTKSFWKILYERKYPDAPVVKYEDVLVFEKSAVLVPPIRRNENVDEM